MDYRECINKDTLNYFARTNEKVLTGPIRGVVLEFPGLGGGSCMGGVDAVGEYTAAYGLRCGRENILLAYVFTGPWSWMNDSAVKITDAVVEAIWDRYGLSEDVPLISTGGSMGGCGALLYCAYGKRKPAACAANGPACDAMDIYRAHPDFARTLFNAVAHYDMSFEEAMASISPIRQVDRMPAIPYYIVHTDMDDIIPIERHSDELVRLLLERGYEVEYSVVPDRGHCDLPPKDWNAMVRWVIDQVRAHNERHI